MIETVILLWNFSELEQGGSLAVDDKMKRTQEWLFEMKYSKSMAVRNSTLQERVANNLFGLLATRVVPRYRQRLYVM